MHESQHPIRVLVGERLRGNTIGESLREENLPPRGSPRGPPRTSERYIGKEDLVTKGDLSEVLGGPLGDPLGRRFSSRRLLVLLPLIVLPLNFSPSKGKLPDGSASGGTSWGFRSRKQTSKKLL